MSQIENDPEKVWEIVKKVRIAMVVTHADGEFEGRPLYAYGEEENGRILLMTDSSHVIGEVGAESHMMLTFADTGDNNYAAIDGAGAIQNDRAKIKELWTPWAEAYWDSPEDPAIRIIAFTPHRARYWDAPNKIISTIAMLAGAVTGQRPSMGKAGDVHMNR